MSRILCVAIHDVAPATWRECRALLDLVDGLGAPATLLVVPDYHRRGGVDADRGFVGAIERRLTRGDEIALHGYHHVDDGPAPHTPAEWFRRRHLTASEGEFAALTEHEAGARIGAGLQIFQRLGWPVEGFVAPAWLLGVGARAALARTRLRYTSTHAHLETLDDGARIAAPVICASARSRWRRWASRHWLRIARVALADAPLLRIALHPADARDADLMTAWRELLAALATDRIATTKSAALTRSLASRAAPAPVRA